MPDNKPPSLGDSPGTKLKMVQETIPLPPNRRDLVSVFESILSSGGVQKVVIQIGEPIKVSRLIAGDLEGVPQALIDTDIINAARNAEMEEFVFSEKPYSTDYLLRAFEDLTKRRLRAKALVVNNAKVLREWLGVDKNFDITEVFGVEVKMHKELPETSALLTASKLDDPEAVAFSLRLEINLPKRKDA